ncbi:MAG: ATP-binding protein [Erysipelotrichaceae bacterium]|nr:ATP-binding protein [Erysipelotrichaceae bacterium]
MEEIKVKLSIEEDDSALNKMYSNFLNCVEAVKETKRLEIPDDKIKKYIVKINDFVDDVNYCKKCPGTAKCKKLNPLLVTRITYVNGVVDRNLLPCPEMLREMEYEKQFYFRDFDEDKRTANLRTLDKTSQRTSASVKVRDFIMGKESKWVFLNGARGTGRTYLAIAVANETANKKLGPIAFINASLRLKELNDFSYSNKSEFERLINTLSSCPLLIIDDFGNEFKNDFIRDGVVFQILSNRASKRLMTIITSDFTIDEIVTLYSTSKAGAIRAKQIGNILKDNCEEEINLGKISIY